MSNLCHTYALTNSKEKSIRKRLFSEFGYHVFEEAREKTNHWTATKALMNGHILPKANYERERVLSSNM